jgi:hypothetical protein
MNLNDCRLSAIRASLASKSLDDMEELSMSYIEIFKSVQNRPTFHKADGVQAHSWLQDGIFHLTFQGADLPGLEFTNINGALINKELLDAFYSIKGYLFYTLDISTRHFHTVQITGHSMGGGIATIAAALIGKYLNTPDLQPVKTADKTKKRIVCHTFGAPRVGDGAFVKLFNKYVDESLRFVIDDDMIPKFPNSSLYTHVSDAICIVDKSIHKEPESKWYWRIFSLGYTSSKTYTSNMYINHLVKIPSNILYESMI